MQKNLFRIAWLFVGVFILQYNLSAQKIHRVPSTFGGEPFLETFIEDTSLWSPGDIILLVDDEYLLRGTVDFYQAVHIEGDDAENPPLLHFYDNGFRAKEDSMSITLKNLVMDGYYPEEDKTAPYVLRFDQAGWFNEYDVHIENVEAYDFRGGIQLYKNQRKHYNSITLDNVYFHDMLLDYVLDPRLCWVEQTTITNSTFSNIKGFIKNYYNDNDASNEWGVQTSKVTIDQNTFYNAASDAFIQQNDGKDGSLMFDFTNNIVSGLVDAENSRPFRIDPLVGTLNLTNNIFHDFMTSRTGGFNLDTARLQANVNVMGDSNVDPKFANPENGNFVTTSVLGDPIWRQSVNRVLDLESFVEDTSLWAAGDKIILTEPEYWILGTIDFYQAVHIEGADPNNPPLLHFYDNGFRAKEDSISITLKNLVMDGYYPEEDKTAPYILRFDQAGWYNEYEVLIENVEAYNFRGGIQLYKNQRKHYKSVTLDNVYFHDMLSDYVLDPRLCWVEQTTIRNSTFTNVRGFIKNYYNDNDGDREWGVKTSKVNIDHNTFYNVASDAFIQQNDGKDGSLEFNFTNNIVSGLLDYDNSRPFRIDPLVGEVNLTNSVFHDFVTKRNGGFNLDTARLQENVTVIGDSNQDPKFEQPENWNFTPRDFAVYEGDLGGGPQGDPEWIKTMLLQEVDLEAFIEDTARWSSVNPIILTQPEYWISGTIDIYQAIHIEGADPENPPLLHFYDNGFRAKEDSISITLKNLVMDGYYPEEDKTAPYVLRFDQAGWYNEYDVHIENVEAYNFRGGIQLYKNQRKHYNSITLDNVYFHDMLLDYVLDPRLCWVEQTTIKNSTFSNVRGFIKNYYNDNDGDREWGVQTSNVTIDQNTFYNVASDAFIQQNDGKDGSLVFNFTNNIVSGLLDVSNSRPFRIDPLVGTVNLTNNIFHDFMTARLGGHNLDTARLQSNVNVTGDSNENPRFSDADGMEFYVGSSAAVGLGDPQWQQSNNNVMDLEALIESQSYDPTQPIILTESEYVIKNIVEVYQDLILEGADPMNPPLLKFWDQGFRVDGSAPTASVTLRNLKIDGKNIKADGEESREGYLLQYRSTGTYPLIELDNVEAWDLKGGIYLFKSGRAIHDKIVMNNVYFHDFPGNDFAINPRACVMTDLQITNSTFANISGIVHNPYKGGDETLGTTGSNITIDHITTHKVGTIFQVNDWTDDAATTATSTIVLKNSILSDVQDPATSRPFLANPVVNVTLTDNVIYNQVSSRDDNKWDYSALLLQSNVTATNIQTEDPQYVSDDLYYYENTSIASGLGDPMWGPAADAPQILEVVHPGEVVVDDVIQLEVITNVDNIQFTVHEIDGRASINTEGVLTAKGAGMVQVLAAVVNGTAKKVAYVTKPSGYTSLETDAPNDDDPIIRMLRNDPNFEVDVLATDGAGTGLDLSGYDLIIAQETFGSGDAIWKSGNPLGIENISAPVIYNKTFALRNGRAISSADASVERTTELSVSVSPMNQSNPLFTGVNFTNNEVKIFNSLSTSGNALDPLINLELSTPGTLLASTASLSDNDLDKAILINDIAAGTQIGSNAANTLNHRMVALAFFYGAMVKDDGHNLTNDGLKIWRNAAYVLTGMDITPMPVVLDIDIKENIIPVRNATLMTAQDTINSVGATIISAEVNPFNATDRSFSWSLSDESLGTLSPAETVESIILNATAPGTVTITATANDGSGVTASMDIFIQQAVTTIDLTSIGGDTTLHVGSSLQFEATVGPDTAVNKEVRWSLNVPDSVAVISFNGLLTALDTGMVVVSATSTDGSDISSSFEVLLTRPVDSLAVKTAGDVIEIVKGETLQMTAEVYPLDAYNTEVTWSVDNTTVATINEAGLLTSLEKGVVIVTATAKDGTGIAGSFAVNVLQPVTAITVSGANNITTVTIGETLELSATIEPLDATTDAVEWSVDNTSIATIDASGVITGVAEGSVTVTATATDGSGITGTISVNVVSALGTDGLVDFNVYPNPTTDVINITGVTKGTVEVIGLSGQVLSTRQLSDKSVLNVSNLKTGVYMLRITTSEGVRVVRFSKD
ncbi:MAG: Ig-like domain-containing protein [Cyclobacteriaceae bacterium]